jgi:ATP-dependent exoDNAse (exonuclease V) alpha subunit
MFRLEAKIISRKRRGKTVTGPAAYRAGTRIEDERYGRIYDYSRRMKGVVDSRILAPEGAPDWVFEPERLWNAVEAGEKRIDSQLAREFILAVPPELSPEAQWQTAADWIQRELVARGMIAEASLHHPRTGTNPHVHVLCTMRKLEGDKFSSKKCREWNKVGLLFEQRESWAKAVNQALEKAGRPERVDHRSLKDRGIDREPEPKIGVAATAMERRGIEPDPKRFQEVRYVKLLNDVRSLMKSVRRQGEIKQHGVGRKWWERSIVFMNRVREVAERVARKTWQKFLGRGKDKGSEPELSR